MKKFLGVLAILVIAMFVLSGCGQKDASESDETKPVPKSQPMEVETSPEPEEEPEPMAEPEDEPEPEPVVTKVPSKKVQDLLTKHSRVTSINYMYQDPLNYPVEWPTWVKDDKMHIELREIDEVSQDVYVSDIYLNTLSKTAKGFCEQKVYKCQDPNEAVDVKFAKYTRKTPFDWIKGVTYAEIETTETMQQRTVAKLVYTDDDGSEVAMWVDDYYGLPVLVEVKKGGEKKRYVFEDIAFNAVEDSDLEHQMITAVYH